MMGAMMMNEARVPLARKPPPSFGEPPKQGTATAFVASAARPKLFLAINSIHPIRHRILELTCGDDTAATASLMKTTVKFNIGIKRGVTRSSLVSKALSSWV